MTTQAFKIRYISRAWVELCLIAIMGLLCLRVVLTPMVARTTIASNGAKQTQPARLFRLIERQHYSISPYDDVGLGDLDTAMYFVQAPPGSPSIRALKDSDFLLIDRARLDKEFKVSGRGSCAPCPFRQTDVPFMSISVQATDTLVGSLVIVGYERRGYTTGQWAFACFVFAVLLVYGYVLLILLWNYSLRELAGALVGLPLEDERRFLLPKRFSLDGIVSGPNGGWFYIGAYTLMLMTLPLGLAVTLVRSF